MTGREWVALFTLIALNGVCYAGIRVGLQSASAAAFGGLRALAAGIVLLIAAGLSGGLLLPRGRDWWSLSLLGVIATTATFGAMFTSPTQMDTGLASLLGNLQPLFIVLLGALFLNERVTARKLGAVALGAAGVLLVLWPALARSGEASRGAGSLLALGASLSAAVGSVLVKRLKVRPGLLGTTGWQLVIGSLPLLAVAAARPNGLAVQWTLEFSLVLLFLALLGTALTTTLWFWFLARHEAGGLSIFLFLIPVMGLGIGAVVFGERVERLQVVGVLVVAVALLLAAYAPQRPSAAAGVSGTVG